MKIRCYKCGNEYVMAELKMDPNRKNNLVCVYCLGLKQKPAMQKKEQKTEPIKTQKKSASAQQTPKLISYWCTACKYAFKRKEGIEVESCPYCSKEGTIMVKKDSASLIKESSDMDEW